MIIGFSVSGIFAQSIKTPKINKKQKVQVEKIKQGVKSGELTRYETKRLIKQEAKLQKNKKIAKADGVITPKEKKQLRKEIRKLDAKIYKQKHDKQKRK
jgi:tellurite resistance protein